MLRAMERCERSGFPAVGVFGEGFRPLAQLLADQIGVPHARLVYYPGVMATEGEEALVTTTREVLTSLVVEGLCSGGGPTGHGAGRGEGQRTDVAFVGGFDEVQDHFEAMGWSDGLPVVPPTPDRVGAFLAQTPRDHDEVLATLAPDHREATVFTVAAQGVMAGCRPEHMPILVAIAEAMGDPRYRVEDAGSTPGWEPLVVLSGPLVDGLGFNAATGAMRVGNRANTSVGRFARLLLRNVAGFRIPPGVTDQAGFGATFNVALCENDEAVADLGWPTFRQDRGFDPADTVVTLQGSLVISTPIYSDGDRPDEHLSRLCDELSRAMAVNVALPALKRGGSHTVLAMSPAIARVFASHGVGKPEIVHALVQGVRTEAHRFEGRGTAFDLHELVRAGRLPLEYALSHDPDRLVRTIERDEFLTILVSGNPARNQSRAYIGNHVQGAPVSVRVDPLRRRRSSEP